MSNKVFNWKSLKVHFNFICSPKKLGLLFIEPCFFLTMTKFFYTLIFIISINFFSCKPDSYQTPCDPNSKTFKAYFILRTLNNETSSFCNSGTGTSKTTNPTTNPTAPILSSSKDITAFSFPGIMGIINGTKIVLLDEVNTSFLPIIATFTTTGTSVKIGATTQVSGTTANTFSTTLTYTVTALDGTTKDYLVIRYLPRAAVSPATSLKIWLRAQTINVADGANVTSWNDDSGIGNHVTSPGTPPTFSTTGMNGKQAVNFVAASSQYLRRNAGTGLATVNFSILSAYKPNFNGINSMIFSISSGACVSYDKYIGFGTGNILFGGVCNLISTNHTTATQLNGIPAIVSFTYTNTVGSSIYYNSFVQSYTHAPSANFTNTDFAVGARIAGGLTDYLNGQVSEILYFDTAISDASREKLECYLASKYGITISLPCN